MDESYQAVYDAVRSRFSNFDSSGLIDSISSKFDISWTMSRLENTIQDAVIEAAECSRFAILKPKLYADGDMWCCLLGDNLQVGIAGFGETPYLAIVEWNKAFHKKVGD